MTWPAKLLEAFSFALDVEAKPGVAKDESIRSLLDETARRAVWRVKGNPSKLEAAYTTPFTPLGSVTAQPELIGVKSYTLHGQLWGDAVSELNTFVRENPQLICTQFKNEQVAYGDQA